MYHLIEDYQSCFLILLVNACQKRKKIDAIFFDANFLPRHLIVVDVGHFTSVLFWTFDK
jgi:hypothetical protein